MEREQQNLEKGFISLILFINFDQCWIVKVILIILVLFLGQCFLRSGVKTPYNRITWDPDSLPRPVDLDSLGWSPET